MGGVMAFLGELFICMLIIIIGQLRFSHTLFQLSWNVDGPHMYDMIENVDVASYLATQMIIYTYLKNMNNTIFHSFEGIKITLKIICFLVLQA